MLKALLQYDLHVFKVEGHCVALEEIVADHAGEVEGLPGTGSGAQAIADRCGRPAGAGFMLGTTRKRLSGAPARFRIIQVWPMDLPAVLRAG